MKRALSLVVFALSANALLAQDLTGTWQGTLTLPNGNTLRQVFKIARDGETLRGTLHNIDQTPQPIPLGAVTLNGSNVSMTIPALGGKYEGRLESDRNNITGSVTQGPNSMQLNLVRATPETAWAIPEPPPPPKVMTDPNPSFEVATIKPSDPNRPGRLYSIRPDGQIITINTTLADLITFAYGIHAKQIDSAPAWAETDKFDVTGKPAAEGQANIDQMRIMIQGLLAERFQLQFKREKKELSVYTIRKGKGEPKLTRATGNPNGPPTLLFRGLGNLPGANSTMDDLAGVLQLAVMDRPVINQTEIEGRWDFQLAWMPDEFQFPGRPQPAAGQPGAAGENLPDIFTAFREQLGLSLEATKAPADAFVITKVEKPSEN